MKFLHSLCVVSPEPIPAPETLYGYWENFGSIQSGLCWTLSFLRLKNLCTELGGTVEFWGNEQGIDFINELGLIYDKIVHISNEDTERSPERFWSFGKVLTLSKQTVPFLHVDGDAFFAKPPPEQWLNSAFIVQGREEWNPNRAWSWFYGLFATLSRIGVRDPLMDLVWETAHSSKCQGDTNTWNFGVVGGSSSLIPEACDQVVEFARKFAPEIDKCGGKIFPACVLEQMWVPLLLRARGVEPTPLLSEKDYQKQAVDLGYAHYLENAKKSPSHLNQVRNRVAELWPEAPVLKSKYDIRPKRIAKQLEYREPSLSKKAQSLSKDMAAWMKRGLPTVPDSVFEKRLAICSDCEFWDEKGFFGTGKCLKCGCSSKAKLKMATSKCPVDKWGPEEFYAKPTTNTNGDNNSNPATAS